MELHVGDRVRLEDGDVGIVMVLDRLTAYVNTDLTDEHKTLTAILVSSLTRIESAAQAVAARV